jgi:UDPglucose 6-dehydrogenase
LIILTDWTEFSDLALPKIRDSLKYPLIIDGRNLYDPDVVAANGLGYTSIGRPDVFPNDHPATQVTPQRTRAAELFQG